MKKDGCFLSKIKDVKRLHDNPFQNYEKDGMLIRPDFLETLQIVSELHIEGVGGYLGVLSILVIFLSVEKPVWDLELAWISNDGH